MYLFFLFLSRFLNNIKVIIPNMNKFQISNFAPGIFPLINITLDMVRVISNILFFMVDQYSVRQFGLKMNT